MCKFARYFAVAIAITMVFLANTVNVAFSPTLLTKAESIKEFSADKNSILNPTQLNNSFHSRSEKIDNRKPESSFQNLWGLDAFNKDTHFDGIKERSDFACFDEDSAELVIGVNNANLEAYAKLVDEINRSQGRIVNTVSIEVEVIAVVADIPWNAISPFTETVQKSGLARYVEPNMKFQAQFIPNDPYWNLQWGPQKIEADYAWNTTTGNSSILVAVIDSGIDYNHPDLEGNYVALGYDWVNDDAYPLDDNGHGTHCAGIIAAALNNTVGIAGIANVSIMAEKGLDAYGSGWEDDLANAIIHAVDYGADVLSNSWGGYGESLLIRDAVQHAYDNGVLVIAAAGNEAWSVKLYPAAYDEVVSVTATDSYDYPASFTNFGDWVEVAAPGVDIYSTMPTYHVTLNDYGYNQTYDYMSGTSMACPHVAGVAALIWSQFANATRDWVRAQLRYTAEDLGDPAFDEYYGYGRINAKNAVEQAPPNHDLLIFDWNRPQYVKLGESATFNITVLNFGASNETDVEVHLLVNGSSINSTYISLLQGTTSTTVSLSWTPTSEGAYNVTYYVVPVPAETIIENNQITEILYVITPPPETNWMLLETDPDEGVGTNLKSIYGQVHSDIVYFKVEHHRSWTTINDIDTAIFIDADQDASTGLPDETYPYQDTDIGADYVIVVGWEATEMWKWDPITGMWDISNPIPLAYLEAPENSDVFVVGVFFVSLETSGIVDCAVTDIPSNWDWMPNSGFFTWILIQYEHELAVLLETPQYLLPGETSLLNATVCNRGLNNETNVEFQLIINGSIVANETLVELVNSTCYTINYSWTATLEGIYNVTAYAPPVSEENFTLNNVKTEFVSVHYPLINPESGQYANYVMNSYDSSGHLVGLQGYFNLTYEYYIEPYKIYITVWQKDPYGYVYTDWMIVNTVNRFVEEGIWYGYWYLGWIETDIGIGSTINLLDGTATVNSTRIIMVGSRAIDCWEIPCSMSGYPYTFWYDKQSGLWIRMESTNPYTGERVELLLIDTNVPIGTQNEHDLGVTLDTPQRLQPDETSLLNATIYNLGLNNETNVEIQLFINGTQVANKTLAKLVNGTWYTLNYSWTPATEGIYNITTYAPPVPDENVTINNIYSKIIPVQYAPQILAYVQYTDYYQDYPNTLKAIESAFGPNYILTELLDYTQLDSILPSKDILLIPDQEYASLYTMEMIGATWSETLTEFLENGGILILCDGGYGYGGTYGILTGAELTSISSANYRSSYTLYLVDPSDPLAEGVSSSFVSPYYTVSFVTEETNVVIEDEWHYPVVIHKEIGRGHIGLLGFDFESSNADTEQLLGNAVSLAAYIPISVNPSAGSPETKVTVTGTKATANGTVSIYWDDTLVENTTANSIGDFTYMLTVPVNATVGVHKIMAIDIATGRTGSTSFRVILLVLNPTEGPIGTNVTVNGAGFAPESQVTVTFSDMLIGYTIIDSFGNFTFTFNTPLSTAGKYYIKALDAEGNYACKKFTVVDVTPLDVQIDVGTMHFKGEIAEFYAQTIFKGQAVSAIISSAILYKPDGTVENLLAQDVTIGLYKIPYAIPGDADPGTYTLVITVHYITDKVQAVGTSFKCFVISSTLTNINMTIQELQGDIATIIIPDLGMIKANLTAINATVVKIKGSLAVVNSTLGLIQGTLDTIQLKVIAINGTTATIQTTLGIMNGTITSIEGNMATIEIETDIGTIKADISGIQGTQDAWIISQYVTIVIALIAAASSMLSVIFLRHKKTAKTE